MDLSTVFQQLSISLGLGLLVGLQRERRESTMAGIRTFPLVTVLGTLAALMTNTCGSWLVAAGFLALAALLAVGHVARLKAGEVAPGLTTEMAVLLMYGVGAYLVTGHRAAAVAVTGGVAVLLHLKPEMHALVKRLGNADFKAIMQFVLISLVILPVLPDQPYGPYHVLNLHRLWLLVVLIVAISLGGYIVYKFFGQKADTMVSGVLGGLISSTATTVSYARRSRETPGSFEMAALVILIASAIVFVRVLVILTAVSPGALAVTAPPLAAMLAAMTVLSIVMWFVERHEPADMPAHANPTELKSALLFTGLFAVVLLATAAGKDLFGQEGLYTVAVLSGLTDMDAVTLSTGQMIADGKLDPHIGWRLVLVAAMSNLVFKAGVVAVLGERKLLTRIVMLYIIAFAAGAVILRFWPC